MSRPARSDSSHRCSSTSWKISAGGRRPVGSGGIASTTGRYTSLSQWWPAVVSATGLPSRCSRYARNDRRSLSSRRACPSCTSSPVSRNSSRRCWPGSATRMSTRSRAPSGEVTSSTSPTSNPRSFNRRNRSATRYRCSSRRNTSSCVTSSHRSAYRDGSFSATSIGSIPSGSRPPALRSISSPATFSAARSTSYSRRAADRLGWRSAVSASTRYAARLPASSRNSVFDSEQSPQ